MSLVDLIIHAWDHEAGPHTYVIITTDRDVAYALSRLRMKEYRIILLAPAVAHSELTSQASIQLNWTRSVLGLTGSSYTDFEHIQPTTASRPSSAPAGQQPDSSRLRRGTLNSIFQESDDSPLPDPPHGRQSSPPFPPDVSRPFGFGSRGLGRDFTQTPPRNSTRSMPDFHISKDSMPGGGPTAAFSGTLGGSSKPLNFSRDTSRPSGTGFYPFDEISPSHITVGKNQSRMGSVTLSTESGSSGSGTRFSFVQPQTQSTAPTSAEDEQKTDPPKPRSLTTSDNVDVGHSRMEAIEAVEPAEEPGLEPVQPPRLPTPPPPPPPPRPVFNLSTAASIPAPVPQPSANARPARISSVIWNPLINTLRQNNGRLGYALLPPKLLHTYPNAYSLVGCSKYNKYIQLAIDRGVVERIEEDLTSPLIQLKSAYM